MTARERLQAAYELAFYPPRLHELWNRIKEAGPLERPDEVVGLVESALLLHLALPEHGYASQRALKRLAGYQADARAFRTGPCLRYLRRKLGRTGPLKARSVPGAMVRDIGLPSFSHAAWRQQHPDPSGKDKRRP